MALISFWCGKVRYPAFLTVDPHEWPRYHQAHCGWVSLLVVPGMLAQLGANAFLLTVSLHPLVLLATVLTAISLGQTLLVSGPIHGKISQHQDRALIEKLVRVNWIRTVAWFFLVVVSLVGMFFVDLNNVLETIFRNMT